MTTWWRRNRLALVLVPVALVLAAAGNASRLDDYWWSRDLHQSVRPGDGGTAAVRTEYDDGTLQYPITADVALTSVTRVSSVTLDGRSRTVTLPDDSALWRVVMHWTADPSTVLSGCQIGIQGEDGRFWEKSYPDLLDAGSTTLPFSPCVPDDTPGPQVKLDLSGIQPAKVGEERPAAYDVTVYVLTAADAAPAEVRVWWLPPLYAWLPVRR
ncbi:MAG: hypothetical protein ABIW80_08325 [Lapillicoccus sp.]